MDFPEVIGRGLQGKRGKRVTCSPAATIIIYNIFFFAFCFNINADFFD